MSNQQHTDPNNIPEPIILAGGRNWEVVFKDGTKQDIFLRKQPFLEMEELAKAWGNMKKEVLCYTQREEAFIATMRDSSVAAVVKEGRALNFLLLSEYLSLQEQTMEAYGQGTKKLSQDLAAAVTEQVAKNSQS